jgi:hypothetical protein
MKAIKIFLLLILPFSWASAQNLKPYILGFESTKSITELKLQVKTNLTANQIDVVGEYQPAGDVNRWIMVITSSELINSAKSIGGLTGFAATLRVAITVENGKTKVSYTNPVYWGNAYFQKKFIDVENNYTVLNTKLQDAMKATGTYIGTEFGSQDGLSKYDLHDYHYMMGMPYFDDTVELEDFDSYSEAVAKIDASIKSGVPNVKMIYKLNIPGKELTLYGFGLEGENGEATFLPIIDGASNPKHTAFLPYEVLVIGDEVHILHGRFRIALAFPDLTMGTFSKIMSTPGAIEDLMEQLVD